MSVHHGGKRVGRRDDRPPIRPIALAILATAALVAAF
jgi:hypothetical protein